MVMWDYQSKKCTKVQPDSSLHAKYKHKEKQWVWAFYSGMNGFQFHCSEIRQLYLAHLFAFSLAACSLEILLPADMAIGLYIYYTRKWRSKRLEAFPTIFTSLPPMFSFSGSRKRQSSVMIGSRVSTDLLGGRTSLGGWIKKCFWKRRETVFALASSWSWVTFLAQ